MSRVARPKNKVTGASGKMPRVRRRNASPGGLDALLSKGLFLRRMFARPRGALTDPLGNPTALALSVKAWGEPVPRTEVEARRLAEKGTQLLQRYHAKKAAKQLRMPDYKRMWGDEG
jgi:hypothetical protein